MSRRCFPLVLSLVALAGCGEPPPDGPAIEGVSVEADRLVVELGAAPLYVLQCSTRVVRLNQVDGGALGAVLETEADRVGDAWDGYWLDGAFRYPELDEGCDVLQCVRLDDDPSVGRVAYAQVGTDAPPSDLQDWLDTYGWGQEAATSVAVVEGSAISGEVAVTLTFHRAADCSDAEHTDSVELSL